MQNKEKILEQLEIAEKDRETFFKEQEVANRKLRKNYKIIEKLKNELSEIELSETKSLEEQIIYFLEAGTGSNGELGDVRYKAREKFWREFGLSHSGSTRDTNQISFQISLTYGSEKSLEQQLNAFEKVLPYIKTNKEGYKVLQVFEHTLSEYGSYALKIKDKKYVLVHRWDADKTFKSLREAFEYIQKHHWYDGKENEDEHLFEE